MKRLANRSITKLQLNTITSLALQVVTAVIGIVLPRLMIEAYGSEVNGLIASITQFLSYISLMEAGTGSVIKAALFKPLVNGDFKALSGVLNACQCFFKKIAYAFLIYMGVLALSYPFLSKNESFSYSYIFWMVAILGISTFAQYFFGLTYQLLLQADQKIYFVDLLQIITLILNFVVCMFLIALDVEIHIVKLATTLIFLLRPLAINLYVRKKYCLDSKVKPDESAVRQRWDGLAHHIAYFMHRNTDVAILTFFSSYSEISVYAVYNSIVSSIQALIISISSSVTSKFGELYAKKDITALGRAFSQYETLMFNVSTVLFSVTGIMIVPFVKVYTMGITDADYQREAFGLIIVFAEFMYVVRTPYSNLAFAAGKFRGTRNGAFIEAGINIALSLALVQWVGIVGVAIGTFLAMLYRTIDYVVYLSKHILKRSVLHFIANLLLSLLAALICISVSKILIIPQFTFDGFLPWVICAGIVTVFCVMVLCIVQLIFHKKDFISSLQFFKN